MIYRSLVVLALLLTFAVTAEAGEKTKLTGSDIAKRISTYEVLAGVHKEPGLGFYFMVVAFQNGERDLYWNDGIKSGTDTGTHRIAGDQICVKWTSSFDGQERCYEVYKIGEDQYESYWQGKLAFTYHKIR